MKEYVICASCGYVMEKKSLGEICPACGVSKNMFKSYVENISSKRKFLLSLDIHPVLVHFPQAFSFTIIILSFLAFILEGGIREKALNTMVVLGVALPFTVAFSFAAGLFDAKIRFRRITTPILIKKMILGSLFFASACGIFAGVVLFPFTTIVILSIGGLGVFSLICGAWLALLGVSLLNAKFPG